jgi:hypothetical protein
MTYWGIREELSSLHRLRRSYYETIRDGLDQQMLQFSLLDSYENFRKRDIPYPFVEKRELKPRARVPGIEHECQNAFLVIFVEDTIPAIHKKYIRFFDVNKTNKINLLQANSLPLSEKFDRVQKYLDSAKFANFLNALLPVDYALLIQRDPASKTRDRYSLTHFHVRIDWPVAEAAENMAQYLRYISKDLFEKGDKYAEDVQKKFFEYYSLPAMSGGRRTAAIVASQYLKSLPCISTVYASSCETRALIRIGERGVSKFILIKFSPEEIQEISATNHIPMHTLNKHYAVAREKKDLVCIFQVCYYPTESARPPADGKLRDLKPDLSWQTVSRQFVLPRPGVLKYPPLKVNLIYAA